MRWLRKYCLEVSDKKANINSHQIFQILNNTTVKDRAVLYVTKNKNCQRITVLSPSQDHPILDEKEPCPKLSLFLL